MRDVWVTGMGVLSGVGSGLDAYWDGLLAGRSAFAPHPSVPAVTVPVSRMATNDFIAHAGVPSPALCDRSALLAVSAARSALEDAGLETGECRSERVAVIIGSGASGIATTEEQYDLVYRRRRQASPLTVPRMMSSSPASWIAMVFGFRGPAFVVSSACASATHAIGLAAQLIESGAADVVVCGGTEAILVEGPLRAWSALGVLAKDTCRPFAKGRTGLVLGEGAGVLVLESGEHVRRRGGRTRARVAGAGASADAGHLTKPAAEGMAAAMRAALADADLPAESIGYVNAHGTGTPANDPTETTALKDVFGDGAVPPVSSTKGTTGHALGASGGLEAVATLLALEHGVLPPTANFDEPDPECDLDYVPNEPRTHAVRAAMSNSFAFGGLNASLVLSVD